MKDYYSTPLKDNEARALLDLTLQNDKPLKPIPYPGDYKQARKGFHRHAFWFENGHVIGLLLSENLREIPDSIGDLTHLKFIIIEECTIDSKFPESIKKLVNLEYIVAYSETSQVNEEDLILIKLDFPDVMDQLKALKSIVAEGYISLYLPPSFEDIKNLEEIYLYTAVIYSDHGPIKLDGLQALKKFTIEYVDSTMFDLPSLSKLKSLKKLKINHVDGLNEKILSNIFEISNLEELNLGYCKLTKIPENIGNLYNITDLDLHWNDFQEIPDSIGNLKNLKRLNLHFNLIKNMPLTIKNCQNIEEIILSTNHYIENFEEWSRCLLDLPKLKTLSIVREYYDLLPKELIEKPGLDIKADF